MFAKLAAQCSRKSSPCSRTLVSRKWLLKLALRKYPQKNKIGPNRGKVAGCCTKAGAQAGSDTEGCSAVFAHQSPVTMPSQLENRAATNQAARPASEVR